MTSLPPYGFRELYEEGRAAQDALAEPTPVGTAPLSRTVEVVISEADYSTVILLAQANNTTTSVILRGMLRQECRVARRGLMDVADLYTFDPVAEALTGDGR